jgi:hypothetical protein
MRITLLAFGSLVLACGSSRTGLVHQLACGDGTVEVDNQCVPDSVCGTGTHSSGGMCVGNLSCGQGTRLQGTECVTGISCGSGTVLQGTQCVAGELRCGPGTSQQGSECIATGGVTCGAGTVIQGTQCVSSGSTLITCGAGTVLQQTVCVALADAGHYEVRVPVTAIGADGYSVIPVFSIGTLASGVASNEQVVLTVVPSYAGSVSPAAFSLGELGSTSYFTPCSAASPACTGAFELHLALASQPSVPVASSGTLTLVAPTGVGSDSPCLAGPNVIFFKGDSGDYIFPGTTTITQGTWSISGNTQYLTVHVTPMDRAQGLWWDLDFSTQQLGQPLAVNVYRNAERAAFASPNHPGIDLGGDGRGCNEITGAFEVEKITVSGTSVTEFLASFEQHCEGGTPALRGCVHYTK